jgi:exodeoxyribonuclease VII large subunit
MIPATARNILDTNRVKLDSCARALPVAAVNLITAQRSRLERAVERTGDAVASALLREKHRLQSLDDKATLLSPVNTLRRGYSLVMKDGKCVTAAAQLQPGDPVTVQFAAGKAAATINHVNNQQ